jgi:hypothetical protein
MLTQLCDKQKEAENVTKKNWCKQKSEYSTRLFPLNKTSVLPSFPGQTGKCTEFS